MNKNKLLSSSLLIAFIFNLNIVFAQQYTLQDDDVVVLNGEIVSCNLSSSITDIIIPETLDGQSIIKISGTTDGVFSDYDINSVKLPSTIEFIGFKAFYYCGITTLDLSSCTSLKQIANMAFSNNKIKHLDLTPCTALQEIGESAFYLNKLEDIDLSGSTSLLKISKNAFDYNNLVDIDLSYCTSLVYIGKSAFNQNTLTEITLPTPLKTDSVFMYWKDGIGGSYGGGTPISDLLNLTFTAFFRKSGVGIEESTNTTYSIYPNPTSDFLNIEVKNWENSKIQVYNSNGKLIQTIKPKFDKETINLSNYSAGAYMVVLRNKTTSKHITVIKK